MADGGGWQEGFLGGLLMENFSPYNPGGLRDNLSFAALCSFLLCFCLKIFFDHSLLMDVYALYIKHD